MGNRIEVVGSVGPEFKDIITLDALCFLGDLAGVFSSRRKELLEKRKQKQQDFDNGILPDFLSETQAIRDNDWQVTTPPAELQRRKVEITGPASNRKMVINALNSDADVYMADAEDSESPTWNNIIWGQLNLYDAIRRTIVYTAENGKKYSLNEKTAVLMFRPRGLHLVEKHVLVDGEPISASLFDFGLYFYHNIRALLAKGSGVHLYLPKMESYLEAEWWNDVLVFAEGYNDDVPFFSISATTLIETLPAVFQMNEILYSLRLYAAGLNCGRWDYIFSFIKKLRNHPEFVLPDRALLTMDKGFLASYVDLLVQTCHRRGAHAMGGMTAQIPVKDVSANAEALAKVRADKAREVKAGHDGTWVAHPGLVSIAREVFNVGFKDDSQKHVLRKEVSVSAKDLLTVPAGAITENGLRTNISVSLQYLESWLRGVGCVPINNLMEDAATAEISRSQVWQWVRHHARLVDGREVTLPLVHNLMGEEVQKLANPEKYEDAANLFYDLIRSTEMPEFFTLQAYTRNL